MIREFIDIQQMLEIGYKLRSLLEHHFQPAKSNKTRVCFYPQTKLQVIYLLAPAELAAKIRPGFVFVMSLLPSDIWLDIVKSVSF